MLTAVRFVVSGRVQGVSFRVYTRARALALGLRGYAINLHDGRVEVLVVGNGIEIDALAEWLWLGSPMARVDAVTREQTMQARFSQFDKHQDLVRRRRSLSRPTDVVCVPQPRGKDASASVSLAM